MNNFLYSCLFVYILAFASIINAQLKEVTSPPLSGSKHVAHNVNPDMYAPTECESCVIFSRELETAVRRLPPKMPRDEAEAWLIEELEKDGVCKRMLDYRLHREREGVTRFTKESPRIAQLAHEMEARGVELRLDIPINLLNEPTIESDQLRRHCEFFIEEFESEIELWFFHKRGNIPLERFLCGGENFLRRGSNCHEVIESLEAQNGNVKNEL